MTSDVALVQPGVRQQLDPRLIQVQRIVGWITAVVILGPSLIGLAATALFGDLPRWLSIAMATGWLALAGLLVWLAERWPAISYRHASYTVDEDGIEIRGGVLWRGVTNVPRTRVQHTDVSQGPLERSHGLGTLVIHTAGTEHAVVALNGLDYQVALALRDHLLPRGAGDAV
jgi:membrane protein YdbS with pleckstrin-like domain